MNDVIHPNIGHQNKMQEAFGYIGSSKMAYQMTRKKSNFPTATLPVCNDTPFSAYFYCVAHLLCVFFFLFIFILTYHEVQFLTVLFKAHHISIDIQSKI